MTHECEVCGDLLDAGYPCERCGHDPITDNQEFAFDGGRDVVADDDLLVESARAYVQGNLSLLEDLVDRLEGNDEGRAMFAVDGLKDALEHLEAIGGDEPVVDVDDVSFGPTNGGVVD